MRIAFILRSEFGLLGTNASYMFPTKVANHHDVLVLTSPVNTAEANLKVFDNPDLPMAALIGATLRERVAESLAYLDRFKPDIVHLFNFRDCLLYPVIAKQTLSHPGRWLLDIRTPLLEENSTLRRRLRIKNLLLQGYLDWVTSHSAASVPTVFPKLFRPLTITPPGVDLSAFHAAPERQDLPADGNELRRYVYVGSVSRRRKIETLIHMFENFALKAGDSVTLDICGGGNTLEAMRDLVRKRGIEHIVRLLGPINQSDLFRMLPQYDAAIGYVPDGLYDQAPALKILEYAAAGLPIFASDLAGIRAMGRHGFKINYFNNTKGAFARSLLRHRGTAAEARIAEHNLRKVRNWDWQRIVERDLLPVYDRLAGRPT